MAILHDPYKNPYGAYLHKKTEQVPKSVEALRRGNEILAGHPLLGVLSGDIYMKNRQRLGSGGSCLVDAKGNVYADHYRALTDGQWAFVLSHALLHLAFKKAAEWFLSHYPLLGGLAASFKIIEDSALCQRSEIHIAAVNAAHGEIYCNPSADLSDQEWRFVLAHEYLHAGLMHHRRAEGRDRYLWNVACDYCVNGWLKDMGIGEMPSEVLYDRELKDLSAEAIYDKIVKEIRKYRKLSTLRGYGLGDIMSDPLPHFGGMGETAEKGISLDEFFKNALREGLDYHSINGRGLLPAGLVEEIRSLSSPPIPWDVELGR